METAVRFNWAAMGKPDFSACAALVERLPEHLRSKLRKPEEGTLKYIVFLIWTYANRSGRGSAYCIPSQRWLGSKVHRSERTVRRCLAVLQELRLIKFMRRRPRQGQPQTNLYTLGRAFFATLFYRTAKKSNKSAIGQKWPPITPKEKYESLTRKVNSDSHKSEDESTRQSTGMWPRGHAGEGARSVEEPPPRQPQSEWGRRVITAWTEPEWMKKHPSELPPEPLHEPKKTREIYENRTDMAQETQEDKYAVMERKKQEMVDRKALLRAQLEELKAKGLA